CEAATHLGGGGGAGAEAAPSDDSLAALHSILTRLTSVVTVMFFVVCCLLFVVFLFLFLFFVFVFYVVFGVVFLFVFFSAVFLLCVALGAVLVFFDSLSPLLCLLVALPAAHLAPCSSLPSHPSRILLLCGHSRPSWVSRRFHLAQSNHPDSATGALFFVVVV